MTNISLNLPGIKEYKKAGTGCGIRFRLVCSLFAFPTLCWAFLFAYTSPEKERVLGADSGFPCMK
jgi:hypothetical protein